MVDLKQMLDAHVRYEMARWEPPQAHDTARGEVATLAEWLHDIPAERLIGYEDVRRWVDRLLVEPTVTQEAFDGVAAAIRSGWAAASRDQSPLGDVVAEPDFERMAESVIGMKEVQRAIITQITTSEVYSRLISHVLYNGLKQYLTNENLITRRVPGASSVVKLGQSALGSAAPGLGKGIDRQLEAFVNSNIADTMRDSRDYLNNALDDDMLLEVATEVYQSAAATTVAEAAGQLPLDSLDELVASGADMWIHVRGTAAFATIADAVVADLYRRWGGETVGSLWEIAGLDHDDLVNALAAPVAAAAGQARDSGLLEQRIRERLQPFYDSYSATD